MGTPSPGAGADAPAPASSSGQPPSFGRRLAAAVAARESQVVLGLDPDPRALWPVAAQAPDAGAAVLTHCRALIDAAGPACVAVKPQLACFERLGAAGWAALEAVAAHARERGLLVLLDGKRGDVPVSARAYADALLAAGGPLAGDAVTLNPLLGRDALEPLLAAAATAGAGAFVLVRTSNPGAADVLDLTLASGRPLWERLAELVTELGGDEEPIASVGAVTGATVPAHLERMRELMPRAPFLLPGIGAQGGTVEELGAAWAPGRAGGLISASRSIASAHATGGGEPASAARAEAERLRALAWSL